MRKINFTYNAVEEYYRTEYASDLKRYFKVTQSTATHGINMILYMDWRGNPSRPSDGSPNCKYNALLMAGEGWKADYTTDTTEKNFMFAGIYYFMILIPQTLREMFGKEVEYDFYRATGWPLSSAGLGGYLEPRRMLDEAALFPCEVEKENFRAMMEEVSKLMISEISEFLSGENSNSLNQSSYMRLKAAVQSSLVPFMEKIRATTREFINTI